MDTYIRTDPDWEENFWKEQKASQEKREMDKKLDLILKETKKNKELEERIKELEKALARK